VAIQVCRAALPFVTSVASGASGPETVMKSNWTALVALSLALVTETGRGMQPALGLGAGSEGLSLLLVAAAPAVQEDDESGSDDGIQGTSVEPAEAIAGGGDNESREVGQPERDLASGQPGSPSNRRLDARGSNRSPAVNPQESRFRTGNRPGGFGSVDRQNRDFPASSSRRGGSRNSGRRLERGAPGSERGSSEDVSGSDYSNYRLIAERNIFNTTRVPRSNPARGEGRRTPPTETLTLVGILSYGKGSYAFFDGSNSRRAKVLETGGTVATYQIADIAPDLVRLQGTNTNVELRVGMKLRKGEDGWQVVGSGAPTVRLGSNGAELSAADSSGDENDIVKRLMRQREEETK
jgi:hypothetical protein